MLATLFLVGTGLSGSVLSTNLGFNDEKGHEGHHHDDKIVLGPSHM